jgi:hypothetical protein
MAEQVRFDSEYRAFINDLHRRLLATGTSARFDAGTNRTRFWAGVCLVAIASIGLGGLIVRALEANAQTAALLVGIFLATFVWYAATYFRRNRPGHYRPDSLPDFLLPRARN